MSDRKHIVVDIGPRIEADVVSPVKEWKLTSFVTKSGLTQFQPDCSNFFASLIFGKSCELYMGEFAEFTGKYVPNPPRKSLYVEFRNLRRSVATESEVASVVSTLKGYSKEFPVRVFTNSHGVRIADIKFEWDGGRSYRYAIILGPAAVLIANSHFIDLDSIAL